MADITNGHDFDALAKKSDQEGISYFMGAVSQALKEGNRVMTNLEAKVEGIGTSVNTINNKLMLSNQESKIIRDRCNNRIEDLEERSSRDYRRLNVIDKNVNTDHVSTNKARSYVTWIIGIAVFSILLFNTFKGKSNTVVINKKDLLEIIKEK